MNETATNAAATGLSLAALGSILLVALALYVFTCFCLKLICEKCGVNPGVLIWIPIVQILPLLQVAGMAPWMLILFLIPFVNFVIGIMLWAKICAARGKSPWLVILMFIPVVNIAFIPYLAFSE